MEDYWKYCQIGVHGYPEMLRERGAKELKENLESYAIGGYNRSNLFRCDHRAWRRALIRECLHRGLIREDPMDSP